MINYRTKEQQCLILLTVPPEIHRKHRATQNIKTTAATWPSYAILGIDFKEPIVAPGTFVHSCSRHGTKTNVHPETNG